MSLKDILAADFKDALKERNEVKKNTINLARAAVKQYEVDNRTELDDTGIVDILTKQVKMRKDAISDFEKAGRTDLMQSYNEEIAILSKYLPEQLSEEEVGAIIKETMEALGIEGGRQNFGKLMGAVMPKVKGRADGNIVKKLMQDMLA